jgi:arsenate reductase (glutaredoxin)
VPAPTIYHNPHCSKSRQALELLRGRGIEPRIIEYLKTPPTETELAEIVGRLGMRPEALVRKNEDIYKANYAGRSLSDEEWIAALARDPVLMERPIVVAGTRAAIGRPPEQVLALLDD